MARTKAGAENEGTLKVGVQKDEDGFVDTVVLDFGKTKRNRIFLDLKQAEWLKNMIEKILADT